MRGSCFLYPSLKDHFSTMQELADAGCMCLTRLHQCLKGKEQFKKAEKIAIMNYITVKNKYGIPNEDLFDLIFKDEVTT